MLKCALSVTPSTPVSRRWWIPADVSAASTRSLAWTRSKIASQSRTEVSVRLFVILPLQTAGALFGISWKEH